MGTKYFSTNLYGYEIFFNKFVWVRNNFYKFGQNFLDRAQFLEESMK